MTPDHARSIDPDTITQDAADALSAEDDRRAMLRDGAGPGTIGVYYLPAPVSSAPGGPWHEVVVSVDDEITTDLTWRGIDDPTGLEWTSADGQVVMTMTMDSGRGVEAQAQEWERDLIQHGVTGGTIRLRQ